MGITERQEKILNNLIQDYIETAKPIGSVALETKHKLGICGATIRNEMQQLTELGYLEQPHTSAGRTPTNKAYRFFIDNLLSPLDPEEELFFKDWDVVKKETGDIFTFTEKITKTLASTSSTLALIYFFEKNFLWKNGWREVFHNPEFKEIDFVEDFIKTVEDLEQHIKGLIEQEDFSQARIFIGKEKSILNSGEFSLLISQVIFPNKEQGLLALLGPKRMDYNRNINLINSLKKILQ